MAPTAPTLFDTPTPLPIGPLVKLVDAAGGIAMLQPSEADERVYHRAKQRGHVSAEQADRLSIALVGLHPANIWGADAWIAGVL